MTSQVSRSVAANAEKSATPSIVLLTPKEAAKLLKVSLSWLAKARMRGNGPPFLEIGRSVRYSEATLVEWIKAQQRLTTGKGSWGQPAPPIKRA